MTTSSFISSLYIICFCTVLLVVPASSAHHAKPCKNNKDCSNNGVCSSKTTTSLSGCSCNAPWTGPYCESIELVNFNCTISGNVRTCKCASDTPIIDETSKQCRDWTADDCIGN